MLDPMRPIKPEIVDEERHEDHRQDLQHGTGERDSAEVMERKGNWLPREEMTHLGAPDPSRNAKRQSQVSAGNANQCVHPVVPQPRRPVDRPDLLGDNKRYQGKDVLSRMCTKFKTHLPH